MVGKIYGKGAIFIPIFIPIALGQFQNFLKGSRGWQPIIISGKIYSMSVWIWRCRRHQVRVQFSSLSYWGSSRFSTGGWWQQPIIISNKMYNMPVWVWSLGRCKVRGQFCHIKQFQNFSTGGRGLQSVIISCKMYNMSWVWGWGRCQVRRHFQSYHIRAIPESVAGDPWMASKL